MDLHAIIGQFFNEKGEITLQPEVTFAGMCEVLYQTEKAAGTTGRKTLRLTKVYCSPTSFAKSSAEVSMCHEATRRRLR